MKDKIKKVKITTLIAVILMVAGFLLPPVGIIDNSVLIAGSLLLLFNVVERGADVVIERNNTKVKIDNPNN